MNLSHLQVKRAVATHREQRPIGRAGLLLQLSEKQEEELLEFARESYLNGHPLRFSELQDKVFLLI
jgi:hypothetical protein